MAQDSGEIVRRWFEEVWNQRRAETIWELTTSESVCHTDDGPIRGPDEFRQCLYEPLLAGFPDLRVEIETMLVQGDQVVVRWSATGTHSGDCLGCKATQERPVFRGMTWVHARDGKMMEGWQSTNIPDVLRQLREKANA